MQEIAEIQSALSDGRGALVVRLYIEESAIWRHHRSAQGNRDFALLLALSRLDATMLPDIKNVLDCYTEKLSRTLSRLKTLELIVPHGIHFHARAAVAMSACGSESFGSHERRAPLLQKLLHLTDHQLEAVKQQTAMLREHLSDHDVNIRIPDIILNHAIELIKKRLNRDASRYTALMISLHNADFDIRSDIARWFSEQDAEKQREALAFLRVFKGLNLPTNGRHTYLLFPFHLFESIDACHGCLPAVAHYLNAIARLPEARYLWVSNITAHVYSIIRTPRDARQAQAETLARQLFRLAQRRTSGDTTPPHQVDLENVMQKAPIARAKEAILALDARFPRRPPSQQMVQGILHYLQNHPATASTGEAQVFAAVRGGASELANATRTLQGASQKGDYAEAIARNAPYDLGPKSMGLRDITGLVWHAIDRYEAAAGTADSTAKDKDVMRFHVFKALSQCIEDDGHRVCAVGFVARLTSALQGYYPIEVQIDVARPTANGEEMTYANPAAFFSAAAQALDRRLGGAEAIAHEDLNFFVVDTRQSAADLFGPGSRQAAAVNEMMSQYMALTYDWTEL